MQWSKLKKHYESLLPDTLKGRVQIHATRYRRGKDEEIGRIWITLDKQQIFSSGDGVSSRHDEWYIEDNCVYFNHINGHHLSQRALLSGLDSSIEYSLTSGVELLKALAMFDKRVGKRRLQTLLATMDSEPLLVKHFHAIRYQEEEMV